jgi:hypothetical protein
MECQLRPIFLRLVGATPHDRQDDLRDDARTRPALVLIPTPTTSCGLPARAQLLRGDALLLSTRPERSCSPAQQHPTRPGRPQSLHGGLRRVSDGFFLKMSYLFHM